MRTSHAALVRIDTGERIPITLDRFCIGRAPGSDLRLDDPMVAGRHCQLIASPDGAYTLRDQGSPWGTFVGPRRVDQQVLVDGDELMIGPFRLRFAVELSDVDDSDELAKLRAIVELGRSIGVEHDLDRLLTRILETCFQLVRADRGMIVIPLAGGSRTVARTRTGPASPEGLSTSVLSEVMETRKPALRTTLDNEVLGSESLSARGVVSVIAVPLYIETRWLGVIQLESSAITKLLTQRDLDLLVAVAHQAALAVHNALLVEEIRNRRSEEWMRLARVVANLPVGVVVLDDRHRLVLANEWIRKRSAVLGEIREGFELERFAETQVERLTTGDVRLEVPVGDTTLVIEARTSTDGRETVIVVNDITAERAQQTKAAHQQKLASIGQLAGGIAHDFNNLLFIILNQATMLLEDAGDAPIATELGVICDTAQSAAGLVKQLLAFSRREVVRPKVIDIVAAVADMKKMLTRAVGEGVKLELVVPSERHQVLIDPSQLEQILMNLAVNARDAMDRRGSLAIAFSAANDEVEIRVTDTGSGMPPDVIARIFEPYFTTKDRGKGTGLGLATVHGIVEQAGGTIRVTSTPGAGTTFRIAFPETTLASNELEPRSEVRGTVLLVDDDDGVRHLTERMLRGGGYHVISVASGKLALEAAATIDFDLLLTDMVMPGMSGRELAREVEQFNPAAPVVFMSGYNPGAVPTSRFIAKPFDRPTLLAQLEAVLESD